MIIAGNAVDFRSRFFRLVLLVSSLHNPFRNELDNSGFLGFLIYRYMSVIYCCVSIFSSLSIYFAAEKPRSQPRESLWESFHFPLFRFPLNFPVRLLLLAVNARVNGVAWYNRVHVITIFRENNGGFTLLRRTKSPSNMFHNEEGKRERERGEEMKMQASRDSSLWAIKYCTYLWRFGTRPVIARNRCRDAPNPFNADLNL